MQGGSRCNQSRVDRLSAEKRRPNLPTGSTEREVSLLRKEGVVPSGSPAWAGRMPAHGEKEKKRWGRNRHIWPGAQEEKKTKLRSVLLALK